MIKHLKTLFFNPRMFAVFWLGFSSGLPLMLTLSTMQAWFTESGVSLVTIGAMSLVGTPYALKFLWAPLMDRYQLPAGGRRRGWVFLTQLALCFTLLVLSFLDPKSQPLVIGAVAFCIAFFSATQDIAIDAYRTDILMPEERGIGSAYNVFAYRLAMLVSGGLALVFAAKMGWRFTYQLMAAIMGLLTLVTLFAPDVRDIAKPSKNIFKLVVESFGDLLKRDSIVLILLFVLLYKIGDALAFSLITTFLLHGVGFSLIELGLVVKTVSIIGIIAGAFVGGACMLRLGLYRSLLWFGMAQTFSTLLFMLLAIVGKSFSLMVVSVLVENFCSGMSTAAFMAFLMSLCHQRYTATQYACLSALMSVGRVFLGPVAGEMVTHMGWVVFFAWSFTLSFPGLILLVMLRSKVSFNAKMVEC